VSRETRLLIATISVSAVVLLLLSQFRFPARQPVVVASPPPLERLAARATYDELAAIVAGVQAKVAPALVVLRLAPQSDARPRQLTDVVRSVPSELAVRHVPALRLDATTAVAALDPQARIVGIVGPDGTTPPAEALALDPVRRIGLVRVPAAGGQRPQEVAAGNLRTPTYVVAVEGTRAGLTFRPVFVGSSDRFVDPRWPHPLLAVSSAALVAPGALMFSLEGQFLGCAVVEAGTLAIAEARDVTQTAQELANGSPRHLVETGLSVQPLTSALARALGARHGVVVAEVTPDGPASAVLQAGDVITAIDDVPVEAADDFLVRLAQHRPGDTVSLLLVRHGEPLPVALALGGPAAPEARTPGDLELQARRSLGSAVLRVAPGSAAEAAGLQAGDLIVRAGELAAPTPAQVDKLRAATPPSAFVILAIERDGRGRVVALPGSAAADAAR
jgi:membrane-associated protease RseP (regulator of RpoE activity)